MNNYLVKTPLRGLRRADGDPAPIGVDEVVFLPWRLARSLVGVEAIEETDRAETCPIQLHSEEAPSRVAVVGADALDRADLIAALAELGGIVFFVGEGLPDDAEQVLADFSNVQLLDELAVRVAEGRLTLGEFPTALLPSAPVLPVAEIGGEGAGAALPPIESGGAAVERTADPAITPEAGTAKDGPSAAPVKPTRKAKATS